MEKLSCVVGNLLDEHCQQQKDVEALFQSLERLQNDKADKEDLVQRIDAKADKAAVAGKVSLGQFEANMERLNEAMREMLSRVTVAEQGWQQAQRELLERTDAKLDRRELGLVQQQLEEWWQSIQEKLKKAAPAPEANGAAGLRKQLGHFHCLSCDRPRNVPVPGPHTVALPALPPLLPHLPARPRTKPKQQPKPQPCHREWAAECGFPGAAQSFGARSSLPHPPHRCPRLQPLVPSTSLLVQRLTLHPRKPDVEKPRGRPGRISRGWRDGQLLTPAPPSPTPPPPPSSSHRAAPAGTAAAEEEAP
ncbi:glutamine-rich protein 2-like [Opisthocomus hoazin]|uniref:glutamine-rich protein 2-like n=1 Tax=Opisthocomus hoazin TaxID=30419 RepID=UPI003F5366D8